MGDGLFVHGGVTSAQEARLALLGLLALQGPTALDVRTGVLVGPGSTTLVTGTSATAPMQVAIGVHDGVLSRGAANGPYLMPTEAVQLVDIGAAPGSGTRIDVVYEKQQDNTPGVPTPDLVAPAPLYGVKAGTAGAGKPSLSAIVGAEELATVAVSAGATATNGPNVVITNTARQTTTRGGIILVKDQAERVALPAPFPTMQVLELDNGRLLWHDGTRFRYHGDLVTVSNTGQRDALTAYEGLQSVVTGAGKFLYTAGAWITYNQWQDLLRSTTYNFTPANGSAYVDLASSNYTIVGLPPGRELEVEWKAPLMAAPASASLFLRLLIGGVQTDTVNISTGAAPMFGPGRLTGSAVVPSSGSLLVQVQGYSGVGAAPTPIQAGAAGVGGGAVVVRFRVR